MVSTAEEEKQKIIFSAIKPTGSLTLGNYIGAVKNWLAFAKEYKCFYAVADLHSITIDLVPAQFRKNALDLYALFIAFGLDPEKCTLFVQSHVPYHAELTWILNCNTQFGEARRMTQFKDKSLKAPDNVNVGLFDYPVLMAADILLYQADYVPIGKDQKQHLELTRTVAERFNNKYSPTFTVPEGIYPKYGAKVYSLSDPVSKMGKSDENLNGVIMLLDNPDDIMRKFKRAVTDSGSEIAYNVLEKPGISNLLTIYASLTEKSMKQAEKDFAGFNYAAFKEAVGETVVNTLKPIQEKFYELSKDKDTLLKLMKNGAEEAAAAARKTMSKVYKKVGFII